MNIIRTTTTKTVQERNERALYNLDYTLTDGTLERVLATIYSPGSDLDSAAAPTFIGTITCENGQIFCSLPADAPVAGLMGDFADFLDRIKAMAEEETAGNNAKNQ